MKARTIGPQRRELPAPKHDVAGRTILSKEEPASPGWSLAKDSFEAAGEVPVPLRAASGSGPILDADSLGSVEDSGEAAEQAILATAGGKAVLLPYGGFDPRRPPVVLVHGMPGGAVWFKDMAERLGAAGQQVFVFMYDDRGKTVTENGDALAASLQELRDRHYAGREVPLNLIGHCQGGVIARAALNSLERPDWHGAATLKAANPRAGFSKVRLRAIDTPWYGFLGEPLSLRQYVEPLLRPLFKVGGWLGAFEMRSTSRMFDALHEVDLGDKVEVQSWHAREPRRSLMWSLPSLREDELVTLARFVEKGEWPEEPYLRNFARALSADSRFASLRQELMARRGAQAEEDPGRTARSLVAAYEKVMPLAQGDHVSVLFDDPHSADDVVDRIVAEQISWSRSG